MSADWFRYLEFFGSANIAMLLAALVAIYTLAAQTIREKRPMEGGLMSTLSKALESIPAFAAMTKPS